MSTNTLPVYSTEHIGRWHHNLAQQHNAQEQRGLQRVANTAHTITGPSSCEVQRVSASSFSDVHVPACDDLGSYLSIQCQRGGQCWCTSTSGHEVPGTRQQGAPDCGYNAGGCEWERRRQLSRLVHGPVGESVPSSIFRVATSVEKVAASLASCGPDVEQLLGQSRQLLATLKAGQWDTGNMDLEMVLSEFVQGMFLSEDLALSNHHHSRSDESFLENLFGGNFLNRVAEFNLTGGPGTRGFNLTGGPGTRGFNLTGGPGTRGFNLTGGPGTRGFNLTDGPGTRGFNLTGGPGTRGFNLTGGPGTRGFNVTGLLQQTGLTGLSIGGNVVELAELPSTEDPYISVGRTGVSSDTFTLNQTMVDGLGVAVSLLVNQNVVRLLASVLGQGEVVRTLQDVASFVGVSEDSLAEVLRLVFRAARTGVCDSQAGPLYVPRCTGPGDYEQVQCRGSLCWYVDKEGLELPDTQWQSEGPPCPTACDRQRARSLLPREQWASGVQAGTSMCGVDGGSQPRPCDSTPGSSVDPQGRRSASGTASGTAAGTAAGTASGTASGEAVKCAGSCGLAADQVRRFMVEADELIKASNNSNLAFSLGFLSAHGIDVTDRDLPPDSTASPAHMSRSASLLRGTAYAVWLAVWSAAVQFYQRNQVPTEVTSGGWAVNGHGPYLPQCDGAGNWQPTQCYPSTGHCWCVDETGRYIPASLVHGLAHMPQCETPCQRSQTNSALAGWKPHGSQLNTTTRGFLKPTCTQEGGYRVVQWSESKRAEPWCVHPVTGGPLHPATTQANGNGNPHCPSWCEVQQEEMMEVGAGAGAGDGPACEPLDGSFSDTQCSHGRDHCWCVFANGQEVPGTRVNMTAGEKPACSRPRCALPVAVGEAARGRVLCTDPPPGQGGQRCRHACPPGYLPAWDKTYTCDQGTRHWAMEAPHPHTCQWLQMFQVVQTATSFQLLLPSGNICNGDYAGLLTTFNSILTDDLTARGLCHLQVRVGGVTMRVPVCDRSSVSVQCLSSARLGINVTWTVRVSDVPTFSLPDLHNIEMALLGDGLLQRLTQLITSGNYQLLLDSKQFVAEPLTVSPRDRGHTACPTVRLGCGDGYRRVPAPTTGGSAQPGCVICPSGTFGRDGVCVLCPAGLYQEVSGSTECERCPVGRERSSPGAFSAQHYGNLTSSGPMSRPRLPRPPPTQCGGPGCCGLQWPSPPLDPKLRPDVQCSPVEALPCPAYRCLSAYRPWVCPAPALQPIGQAEAKISSNLTAGETECEASGQECDDQGGYRAAQRDVTDRISFCVTVAGQRLAWTETNASLFAADCIVFRQFDIIQRSQLVPDSENMAVIGVSTEGSDRHTQLLHCLTECSGNARCDYVTQSDGGEVSQCELYSSAQGNLVCTAFGQSQGFLGHGATVRYEGISCRYRVRGGDVETVRAFSRRADESTRSFHRGLARTDYRNVGTGVYQTLATTADGSSLTDMFNLCRQSCQAQPCCHGFLLSHLRLSKGIFLCGLVSFPDVLLCNIADTRTDSTSGDGVCRGVASNAEKKTFTFNFGGLEFSGTYAFLAKGFVEAEYSTDLTADTKEEIQRSFNTFQHVYLWQDSDMNTRLGSTAECGDISPQDQQPPNLPESTRELFSRLESAFVRVDQNLSVASQHFQLFKHHFPRTQAELWCLQRCSEEGFCRVVAFQDVGELQYECVLYPDTQLCQPTPDPASPVVTCTLSLPELPHLVYRRKDVLQGSVKSFYTRLPFHQLWGTSIRSSVDVTARGLQAGFLECERRCDEDPCCKGFGFLQELLAPDVGVTCRTLSGLGVQSCGDGAGSWRSLPCEPTGQAPLLHPFGWYQKPVNQWNRVANMCPPARPPPPPQRVSLSNWQMLRVSPILDSTMSAFDVVHVSSEGPEPSVEFVSEAGDWCLSACASNLSCATVTLQRQVNGLRCVLYPDTHTCRHRPHALLCRLVLREAADIIYRRTVVAPCDGRCGDYRPGAPCQCNVKCADYADCCPDVHTCTDPLLAESQPELTSVVIPAHGIMFGKTQLTRVGEGWKAVNSFLGVPYAAPPTGDARFKAPEPFNWTGEWNATFYRPSCLQPGDTKAVYSTVGEDCLYLNLFAPKSIVSNIGPMPVLVFFHNGVQDYTGGSKAAIDGSSLAAVGNLLVVAASYRVGLFGFLSDGSDVMPGNWGLWDQLLVLQWVQRNAGYFGGSPSSVTIAAAGRDAEITSINLMAATGSRPFHRALLLGGSVLSPAAVISRKTAQEQVINLAHETSCPTHNKAMLFHCLRRLPALTLNSAQSQLLSTRGPLQAWGPVVDGRYLQEPPLSALRSGQLHAADLLIGSAENDGLVSRAKALKGSEGKPGGPDGETALYRALQESLGGGASSLLKDAVTWFYSQQRSLDDYAALSWALGNATRDYFITCPVIQMADHWSKNTGANVFMYHTPTTLSQHRSSLSPELQFILGLPLRPDSQQVFTVQDQALALTLMQYVSNFVRSGNPNHAFTFSRSVDETLPLWPSYFDNVDGSNYKELAISLKNKRGLKIRECLFWIDYVPKLRAAAGNV
ncbi:thyroglobulin [Rhinoraja longicauda]